MHQAILNIISNSVDSIDGKGNLSIQTSYEINNIKIEIEDSGIGISEEYLSKISDPFFSTKPPGEGTGLGLFITYGIIKEHHGNIEVFSSKKHGTNFIIQLPTNGDKHDK
jgi:signal transduction histidine kinase